MPRMHYCYSLFRGKHKHKKIIRELVTLKTPEYKLIYSCIRGKKNKNIN